MTRKGLPHSEIPGSKPVCGSPGLIAACHVLHRLCAPRHPPSTLSSLTIKYLRRVVCILIYPIHLSKTAISSDQKALEETSGAVSSADPPSLALRARAGRVRLRPQRGLRWTGHFYDGSILRSSAGAKEDGGADRVRTDDLRLAKPPLSQLSYGPVARCRPASPLRRPVSPKPDGRRRMVGLGRFELPTSRLSGVRSDQLSYRPRKARDDRLPSSKEPFRPGRDRFPGN